jgi:hypothetical protein
MDKAKQILDLARTRRDVLGRLEGRLEHWRNSDPRKGCESLLRILVEWASDEHGAWHLPALRVGPLENHLKANHRYFNLIGACASMFT